MYSNYLARILVFPLFVSFWAEAFQRAIPPKVPQDRCVAMMASNPSDGNSDSQIRRKFVLASTGILFSLQNVSPALAKSGDYTNMQLPNYIEYLIEKNEAGINPENALYKGADPTVLLKRLQEANKRLGDIPALADQKKWSQIQGTLTGPLGTLAQTMNQIATPDSSAKVKEASKKVKSDMISIGQAAEKKNGAACAENARITSRDLESFVKLAFQA
eukprot:scaffold5048_cov121-Cylindrotheca_fusiformis.AAC.21